MATSPREFALEMFSFLAVNIYDEEACLKHIEERMIHVYDTAFQKGQNSAPKEVLSAVSTASPLTKRAGTLYGLPCKSCGRYFPATEVCPDCKV